MNTKFIKRDSGRHTIKARKNIVLNRNEFIENPETGEMEEVNLQTFNPTDEMLFADGWEIYVPEPITLSAEEEIAQKRHELRREIEWYDSSDNVNMFYIGETKVWLDKATRAGLMLRFNSEVALQKENTTLWYNNTEFTLPITTAIQMLYALENYASECYDNTQRHLANVENLTTLEELNNYDITVGYPNKLTFNL